MNEIVQNFWNALGVFIPPSAKVYVSKEKIAPSLLRDAINRPILQPAKDDPIHYIFVDMEPEANWAHHCLFALALSPSDFFVAQHDWPPASMDGLLSCEIPQTVCEKEHS